MKQETPNESVRPIFLLFALAATKLVSHIFLRFTWLLVCALFFFKLLTLGFKYGILRWIFWVDLFLDLMNAALISFFLLKDLQLPQTLMLSCYLLSKIDCFSSSDSLDQLGIKPGEYCVTCSLEAAFWWFLASSFYIHNSSGCVVS